MKTAMLVVSMAMGLAWSAVAAEPPVKPESEVMKPALDFLQGSTVEVAVPDGSSAERVTMAVGQTLVVALRGNATTGYNWDVTDWGDGKVIKYSGQSEYKVDRTDLMGSPGTHRFRFSAVGPGTVELRLRYARPWEKENADAKSVTIEVTVTAKE